MLDEDGRRKYSRLTITKRPDLIGGLAINAFARNALKTIEHNLRVVGKISKEILPMDRDSIMSGLKRAYRQLPAEYYQKIYTSGVQERYREWAEKPYKLSDYKPEKRKLTTSWGLKVRSRAEVAIAEKLSQLGVPFRYEQELTIMGHDLAPDFTFPSRDGSLFFLEYCGMMDDPGYLNRFLWKRRLYEGAGICQWKDMIYLFGDNDTLDMQQIEGVIRNDIMPRL